MELDQLKGELRASTNAPAVNTLQLLAWLYELVCEVEVLKEELHRVRPE